MTKSVLTVTLNPAIDKIVHVNNFCVGDDFRSSKVALSAGGKGINVSRALNCLGISNIATGFLGGTSGDFIEKKLKTERIENAFLKIQSESRTNLTIIDQKNKITRILESGATVSNNNLRRFKRHFNGLLKKCDIVIFSGSIAPGLPKSIYFDLIQMAHHRGVKTILDTNGNPLRLALRAKPFAVKPNLSEAEFVLGEKLNSLNKKKAAVKYLLEKSQIVILSLSQQGAIVGWQDQFFLASPSKLMCVNNVGCGDSLVAGFIYALKNNFSFEKSVRFAVAIGSADVLTLTSGEISKKDIKKILPKILLRRL